MKVVVTGPEGAGTTALIETISEITVLANDQGAGTVVRPADSAAVAMDFGRITVGRGLALYLFGTPAQARFDFLWEILAEGMLGFVLVLDDRQPESFDEGRRILRFFTETAAVPFVVALNRVERDADVAIRDARDRLGMPDDVVVLATDVTDREQVKQTLLALLATARAAVAASSGPAATELAEGVGS